ncbi:transposon Tf2-9 polyprotein [Trichonephila clavata]|uniref:RNA-directed DNA polymerase n=1 Tax=Trichonephila clavata TaxID=2740835 RepID=A0A8X6L746_TRICU|nr:transposon Tf2-9 polyprotein [Trichonephila clavata]
MQSILSVSSETLENLAKLADKIAEVRTDPFLNVSVMDKSTSLNPALPTNPRKDLPNPLYQEVVALRQQVDTLSQQFQRFSGWKFRNRSRTRSNFSRNTTRSLEREGSSEICYYHSKFGRHAKRCRSPDKVDPILNYPQPKTIKKLRRFLGLLNFFRRFLPRAAHNQTHLNDFLKGSKRNDKRKINWSEQAKSEFQNCKALLANTTLMVHPNPNANLVFQIDASDFAIGGALFQTEGEHLQPLAFFSRKLSETEKSYSAYDRVACRVCLD